MLQFARWLQQGVIFMSSMNMSSGNADKKMPGSLTVEESPGS